MRRFLNKLWCLLPLIAGCASNGPDQAGAPAGDLELAYARLASVQSGMVTTPLELEDLIKRFDLRDDAYGAWLASLELCRYRQRTSATSGLEAACEEALARAYLTDRKSALFQTALQLYLYDGSERYLELAERQASPGPDELLLATLRGEFTSLSLPRDAHPSPEIRAFQYYWHGKLRSDESELETAYRLFAETGNARGIADVLYLRAILAAEQGNPDRAHRLAGRSANVLEALGDDDRAARVRRWAANELAAE